MRQRLTFATLYSLLLVLPATAVIMTAAYQTKSMDQMFAAFAGGGEWVVWGLVACWPWLWVLASLRKRAPDA